MKHEIEIPDLPEGYEIGKPKVVYAHMGDNNPVYISIPLKKKQPRRVVLEESDIDNYDIVYRQNGGTTTYWKIVEDTNARNN